MQIREHGSCSIHLCLSLLMACLFMLAPCMRDAYMVLTSELLGPLPSSKSASKYESQMLENWWCRRAASKFAPKRHRWNLEPLCLPQLPGRPEAAGCQRLPTDRAGHPADEGQDDRNRRGPLLLQKPQLQVSRSTINSLEYAS